MHILLLLLRTSRWDALIGMAAGAIVGLATSGFAWTLQSVIATGGQNAGRYALIFAGCWLAYGAGAVLADNRLTRVSQRAVRELRLTISRRILGVPLPMLEREQQRIFPVLIEDITSISNAAQQIPTVISGLVTVIGCFVLLTFISWSLAVACVVLVLIALGGYVLPLHRFERHLTRWRADWDGVSKLLDAIVRGHKELLLDDRKRASFFSRHLEPLCRRQETELTRANTWETLVKRWGELLLLLGVGLLLFTLPIHGWATYEEFGRFLFIALFMLAPLSGIVGFSTQLSRVNLSLDRAAGIGVLLSNESSSSFPPTSAPHPRQTPVAPPHFGLRDVTYRHARDDEAPFDLGPLSLEFDRPEVVFIAGGNGSGKTTLLKLLCGLYPPLQGELHADNLLIDPASLDAYRHRFGVIFSDFFLFDSLLGYEETSAAEAQRLLREVHLDRLVTLNTDGAFSSTRLSQGQRKRLALVATLLEDKPVYVFDEWAADQDPEFRRWFYERILPDLRTRGKLVIAITHDDAFYPTADRIVRLSEGLVVSDTRQTARTP